MRDRLHKRARSRALLLVCTPTYCISSELPLHGAQLCAARDAASGVQA
jgi:hypothetical protein